jgi:hypothetical protein
VRKRTQGCFAQGWLACFPWDCHDKLIDLTKDQDLHGMSDAANFDFVNLLLPRYFVDVVRSFPA